MQIDILSSNTLKLTLSRLDMFDLDIKYESLSGKNPETKRLLAHVLKTIRIDQLDRKFGFDFSCDRIFVEAFPRPDGGCMLYVSSLESDGVKKRKTVQKREAFSEISTPAAERNKRESLKQTLLFETEQAAHLSGVCRSLHMQRQREKNGFESALYVCGEKYRLVINGDTAEQKLVSGIVKEYGELLKGERELMYTKEYFKLVIEDNAVERLNNLL
ncbi:MAG: adaptor protein MecA [Oscillospiraceae bacterium]|nr:adaptor protein MecA [Oscillospiraceae bacterium]